MGFVAAWQFLTIIPFPGRLKTSAGELGSSLAYFPLVGLVLGLILAGLDWLLRLVLPLSVVNVFLLVALILLTGGLHLDGFIDTCDGLAGTRTPQQRWEIMRDSRVGSFGVAGAFCLLLLEYILLGSLPTASRWMALAVLPVLSRWVAVYSIFAFPYAKPDGLGKAFKEQVRWPGLALATLIALALSVALLRLEGLAVIFGVWLISAMVAWLLERKFAGLTGDSYRAIIEIFWNIPRQVLLHPLSKHRILLAPLQFFYCFSRCEHQIRHATRFVLREKQRENL